jgi:hypothetical protein
MTITSPAGLAFIESLIPLHRAAHRDGHS